MQIEFSHDMGVVASRCVDDRGDLLCDHSAIQTQGWGLGYTEPDQIDRFETRHTSRIADLGPHRRPSSKARVMALLRGADLVGLPIVTLGGDDIAEVRDVLFDAAAGVLLGFTLNKRGRLSGRMAEVLPHGKIIAVGPNAVIVSDPESLTDVLLSDSGGSMPAPIGNVVADRVLTDSGVVIGTVTDVVFENTTNSVVGFEVTPQDQRPSRKGPKSYVPLSDTRSVSKDTLIIPAAAIEYVTSDFEGFAETINRYRKAPEASRVSS